VAVAVLVISFLSAAIISRPAPVEIVKGLAFETPPNEGLFGTLLVAAAVIGAVGGSAANLMYPEFMRDKGWRGPGFLRLQQVDLLVGIVAIIVVDLAVWVVAAQTVRANHLTIDGVNDLARMMQLAVGGVGPTLLWLGLFFVTFSSFPAYATGFTKILFAGVYESVPRRRERYGEGARDPVFNWLQIGVMVVVPLVFALPMFPDALTLTVAGSSIGVLLAPFIMAGTIVLTTARRFMMPGYANRWWETVILLAVLGVGLWASFQVVRGLIELVLKLV
jgi:Mn2+/Fe2+ NRAMP family transporter